MPKIILALQIVLNLSGVGCFLFGWYWGHFEIMVAGGVIMVLDDIFTVYSGALNIGGPLIAWAIAAYFISPWWYSLFWSSLVFGIMGVPGSIIKIFTFKQRVVQMEDAYRYSNS